VLTVLAYLSTQSELGLFVFGAVLSVILAILLLSGRVSVRQRTLWIVFVLVIAAITLVWDGIEVRFETGTHSVYWRSDWDWDSGGGGLSEWIATTALFVGPSIAAALVYSAVVQALLSRTGRTRWRTAIYTLAAPLSLLLAWGLLLAVALHPLLFYSERSS
jgi:hypothetical protein